MENVELVIKILVLIFSFLPIIVIPFLSQKYNTFVDLNNDIPRNCYNNQLLRWALESIRKSRDSYDDILIIRPKVLTRKYEYRFIDQICQYVGIKCKKQEYTIFDPDIWRIIWKVSKSV